MEFRRVEIRRRGVKLVKERAGQWLEHDLPAQEAEQRVEERVPDPNTLMILYCGGGFRSALAAVPQGHFLSKTVLTLAGREALRRAWPVYRQAIHRLLTARLTPQQCRELATLLGQVIATDDLDPPVTIGG